MQPAQRHPRVGWLGIALGLVFVVAGPTSAAGQGLRNPTADVVSPPPAFNWQGEWQSQEVTLRSRRTGAKLAATVFAPARIFPVGKPGCLARRSAIGPRNIGRVRLGRTRSELVRRLGFGPIRRTRYSYHWCVKRSSGLVTAVFAGRSRQAKALLVVSTARAHGNRHIRPPARLGLLRRAYRGAVSLGRGLYLTYPRSTRLVGVRAGRVRFFAVAHRRLLRNPGKLLRYLRRAGLAGTALARPPAKLLPAISVVSGLGYSRRNVQWAARDLAGHGYVALTVDPQGYGDSDMFTTSPCGDDPGSLRNGCEDFQALYGSFEPYNATGQAFENYMDAHLTAVDYLGSKANPYQSLIDPDAIGLAGWSLGAATATYLQGIDRRIGAVVAWDNLLVRRHENSGLTPPCAFAVIESLPARNGTPRVPAMGITSEFPAPGVKPPPCDADLRKRPGYEPFREAGLPTMLVATRDTHHEDFSQASDETDDSKLRPFAYYTRNWFDSFLKGDQAAAARLMATDVEGRPRNDILSDVYHSAAFLPDRGVDCPDLSLCAALK